MKAIGSEPAGEGTDAMQVQTCKRSPAGTEVLLGHSAASINLATDHDSGPEVVAGALFLGGHKVLRLSGRF